MQVIIKFTNSKRIQFYFCNAYRKNKINSIKSIIIGGKLVKNDISFYQHRLGIDDSSKINKSTNYNNFKSL